MRLISSQLGYDHFCKIERGGGRRTFRRRGSPYFFAYFSLTFCHYSITNVNKNTMDIFIQILNQISFLASFDKFRGLQFRLSFVNFSIKEFLDLGHRTLLLFPPFPILAKRRKFTFCTAISTF